MNSNLPGVNKVKSSEENNSKKGNKLPVDKRIMWAGIAVIVLICFLVVFAIYSKFYGNRHTSKDLSPNKKDSTTLTREPAKKQDDEPPVPEPPQNY